MAMLTRVRRPNGRRGWGWVHETFPSACAAAAMFAAGCDDSGKGDTNGETGHAEVTPARGEGGKAERARNHGAFSMMTFDEARTHAAASTPQKLVLVDFTATWCPPCKAMDRTTWPNERVVRWIDEHAIAVQVDVDRERSLAEEMGVNAMPTIVLMRGREELGRFTGGVNADQLLAWLDDQTAKDRASIERGSGNDR